jgi:hypothetical protein
MNIQHPHTHACSAATGTRNCVRYIVKFQIKKDFKTKVVQRTDNTGAGTGEKLFTDFYATELRIE